MKHILATRLFRTVILTAAFVAASSGAGAIAWQEKSATDEASQPAHLEKTDATGSTGDSTRTRSVNSALDQRWGPYDIAASVEFGVRGIAIQGNGNKYRSDHNYDPGFRIFDASLMMKSSGPKATLFDELMINTFGWGGEPNRYLKVDATRTDLYKFTSSYRRVDYFNSLTNFAAPSGIPNSQHTANTQYRQGDFDLTLWPASKKLRLNLGYSLDLNSGPSVTTSRYSSDEFPVLSPVRVAAHDYRVGFDSKLWLFDVSFLQGWRFFKDDTSYFIDQQQPGNNTTNTTVIDTYNRDVPTRGEAPYTRFSLHTFVAKRLDFTGRFVYASGATDFTYFDNLSGTNSSNRRVTSDAITILGNAKRPNTIGDVSATYHLMPWLRISDSFRVKLFRINGGDRFNQVSRVPTAQPPITVTNRLDFETINYRRYLNTIEGDVDVNARLSFHVGFRYTDRHVETQHQQITAGQSPPQSEPEEFDNSTRSLIFGFKAKPVKIWTIYFDVEHGDNDNVFTRTANYDYTSFRARSLLRPTRSLSLNASVITRDNTNPTVVNNQDFGADFNTRIFSGSVDWTANEKLNLTGGYTYFHVTTETIVQFNTAGDVVNVLPARYFMREHFAFATAYWQPHERVSVYGSYRIHDDHGQRDLTTTPAAFINSYPYQLSWPEAKVSVKLHKNLDWIAGYQYIDYKEQFVNNQWYQAHLPYTSLRVYIGGRD